MRVTTEIWVAALLKRVFSAGGFAAVVKRGAAEAGSVHVLARDRIGEVTLYAPAPQTSYDSAKPDDRRFVVVEGLSAEAIDKRLASERRFDPDVWIVELEVAEGAIDALIEISAA